MAKLVSTTYGDALFDLAMEENSLDAVLAEVETMKQIFSENEELQQILCHPKMEKSAKIAFAEDIFKGKCSDHMMGFLVLVIEKGRHADLDGIFQYFIEKAKEAKGIGTAYVTSAIELSEKGQKIIEERLLALTKYNSFEMNFAVDESIIGGLVIRIGDRVVDSSIKTKLSEMKKSLTKIQLS